MRFDSYSGDFCTGFFGYAYGAASYLIDHPEFGVLAFGGDVREEGEARILLPRDGFRTRVFIAPAGLWLTLDAGTFERI